MPSRRLSRLAALSGLGLSLAMGVTTGLWIGVRRTPPGSEAPCRETPFETGDASRAPIPGRPATELAPGLSEKPAPSSPSPLALEDGLGRIRSIFAEWISRYPRARSICAHRCFQELGESWDKIRQLALNDPMTYFAFVRAPGNEDACDGLLFLLYPRPLVPTFEEELPAPILQGVADLLASGTKGQRLAAVRLARDMITWGGDLSDHPSADLPRRGELLVEPCLSLLSSDDPRARAAALDVMRARYPGRLEESLPLIIDLWQRSSDDRDVRASCLEALAQSKSPAGTQLFYEKMSDAVREHPMESLRPIQARLQAGSGDQDRCGQLLLSALRSSDEGDFLKIAVACLDLPLSAAIPILEEAGARAPRPEFGDSVRRVLKNIQAGEVRTDRLRAIINGH